jgi:hypothetical protein
MVTDPSRPKPPPPQPPRPPAPATEPIGASARCCYMGTFLGLFALSLILGFVLGRLSWAAIVISSAALAALVVAVLPWHGFEILPGIATLAACLATHQVAYLSFVGHARGSVSRPRPVRQAA